MERWEYTGRVTAFGKTRNERWHGETFAETVQRARSNLKYRYKKQHGLASNMKIDLPDDVKLYEASFS